jgi:hypothetical protein
LLAFVRQNGISWRVHYAGITVGLMGLIGLIPLLGSEKRGDERWMAATAVGLGGTVLLLLAALIDQIGTPTLARWSAGESETAVTARLIWDYVESWRVGGLKTVSYLLLGIWLTWSGSSGPLTRFSHILGSAFLLLALIGVMAPPPLVHYLGENGFGRLVLVSLAVWGGLVARDFWQKELLEIRD